MNHERESFGGAELLVPDSARETLEQLLTDNGLDVERLPASFIMIETDGQGQVRANMGSLDIALQKASAGERVVLASFIPTNRLCDNPRWQAAIAYENVSFVELPLRGKEVADSIQEAAELPVGLKDRLAVDLLTVQKEISEISQLEHNYKHAQREGGERLIQWVAQAEALCGTGTPEELYERVKLAKDEKRQATPAPFAGNKYNGVFVDVEGTLVDENGTIRPSVVAQVEKVAQGRPVTIWTGGGPDRYRAVLRKAGLTWKIVDKSLLDGTTVATAIDDLSAEELRQKYGVIVTEYIPPEIS